MCIRFAGNGMSDDVDAELHALGYDYDVSKARYLY
jgi:hypothetical protein